MGGRGSKEEATSVSLTAARKKNTSSGQPAMSESLYLYESFHSSRLPSYSSSSPSAPSTRLLFSFPIQAQRDLDALEPLVHPIQLESD